jgi:hypothetical protein
MAGFSYYWDADTGDATWFDDDADTTLNTDIDNGPTELDEIIVISANAAKTYLLVFDNETPVIGTTAPDYQFPIAANANLVVYFGGVKFDNGLSFAVTTTGGTASSGDPATPVDVYGRSRPVR